MGGMLPYGAMLPRWREWTLVTLLALALAVAMTWPLAARIGSAGRLDTDDGRFSVWNVAWVARALVLHPLSVYDANIFYPRRSTLAYSEANLGAGALAVPAYWASGGNPYFAHNVVFLLSFVLSQIGMYALVRHLTGRRAAALVSAVAFAFCPYVFSHLPHIQLLMTAGLPLALLAMHRFVAEPSIGRTVALGLTIAAQALFCGYHGVYAALMVTPGIVYFGLTRGRAREWRYWLAASAAGLLSMAVTVPFFLPYLELQQVGGFARTLADARQWSATLAGYVASAAWAHRWLVPFLPPWGEVLYPGTAALVLGTLGAWAAFRRRPATGGRDVAWFYAVMVLVAFWASFGPKAGLYTVLHETVPLFSWLRAPSRFGLVVVLGLAVFAGFAASALLARSRRAAVTAAALVTLTTADLVVAPLFLVEAEPVASAYRSLAKWPHAPVAEFPFFYERMDFPRHAYYMLNSTAHWRPLVNGYSDYVPPEWREMVIPVSSFPNPESFVILQRHRVRYVVFHLNLYSRSGRAELERRIDEFRAYLKPIRVEDPVWLFEITGWPPPG